MVSALRGRLDLGRQRRDSGLARRRLGPGQRRARRRGPQPPQGDARGHQLVGGARGRRQAARLEPRHRPLRLVEPAEQQQPPHLEVARMRGVGAIALPLQHRPRRASAAAGQPRSRETKAISASATTQRARATASFGPKARAARRSSVRARPRSPSCAIAMPRKASAGGVLAQRHPVQRAERITRGQRSRRRGDQRVHANPATLVTLALAARSPSWAGAAVEEADHAPSCRRPRAVAARQQGRGRWPACPCRGADLRRHGAGHLRPARHALHPGGDRRSGMAAMYLLMSLFHAGPWLKRLAIAREPTATSQGAIR